MNHIKGLLSDIVTNTIETEEDNIQSKTVYTFDMKNQQGESKNTPTILQTVLNLDPNIIKDKESFIQVIKEMKKQEKESLDLEDTTPYVSFFEANKQESVDENIVKAAKDKNILEQYFEAYDDTEGYFLETSTLAVPITKASEDTTTPTTTTSTSTTSTSTTSTTTPSTTKSTTRSTTTTISTEPSTTTTTQSPTLLERAGSIVTGGIGGIFNGFASLGQALTQATSPFWIPINVGRKKREIEEIADVVKSQITNKDIFMNFLLFQKRIKAMNPEKLNIIVKEVVKDVINVDRSDNMGEYESLYDELIARQITELLLKPKQGSFDIGLYLSTVISIL